MSNPQKPLQGYLSYSDDNSIQGKVVYHENPLKRILRGVGSVIKDVGGAIIDHAPELLRGVTAGLASTYPSDYSNDTSISSSGYQKTRSNPIVLPNIPDAPIRAIPSYKPSTIGQDALRKVERFQQSRTYIPFQQAKQNPLEGFINSSLPKSVQPSRQQAPYTDYQVLSNAGLAQALNQSYKTFEPIQEDWSQFRQNLSYAQKPASTADYLLQLQKQEFARQQAEAQAVADLEQAKLARARQQAAQLKQWAKERTVNQRQEIPPQKTQSIPLPKAEYNDREEGMVDLWKKLQSGKVLSDNEMKQLFHAIDLQKYRSQTEAEKQNAEWARLYAEQKLAENAVANAERTENGEVLIQGVPVRPEDALYFATQDIQHFQDTDLHFRPDQLLVLKEKYFDPREMKRVNQRTNQIINESHNKGDNRAIDYFKNTINRSTGPSSLEKPLQSNNLSLPNYTWHGLAGKGQDIKVNIKNLSINKAVLKDVLLGQGNYKPDTGKQNPLPKALEQLQRTGLPQKVTIP